MQKTMSDFTGLYPLSKTLRFQLIPQGRTLEYIESNGILQQDEERAQAYKIVKNVINNYHKEFIDQALKNSSLDWTPLKNAIEEYRRDKSVKNKDNIMKVQKDFRNEIVAVFKDSPTFESLFGKKLITELLPAMNLSDQEKQAVSAFKRFSTYFVGFHQNLKNIYSADDIPTSIAFRIVHDNFPKFMDNIAIFDRLKQIAPEVVKRAEEELKRYRNLNELDEAFNVTSYNYCLTQKGIESYNALIGGYTTQNGIKVRGINEFANLFSQQYPDMMPKRLKMTILYKQILSDRESVSFLPEHFESDMDLKQSIQKYYETELIAFTQGIETTDVCAGIASLFSRLADFDESKIYVKQSEIASLSVKLFGDWQQINRCLAAEAEAKYGDPSRKSNFNKIDKHLKSTEFTLSELNKALMNGAEPCSIEKAWSDIDDKVSDIKTKYRYLQDVWQRIEKSESPLRERTNDVAAIKDFLDAVQELLHLVKPISIKGEQELDAAFYSDFEPLYGQLTLVIPLYNRVRNYLTKRIVDDEKYKLNFESPQLAAGWDQNKEKECLAVILIRDDRYYLGILHAKDKPDFDSVKAEPGEEAYQKMVYKLLPGANKMLPKVFFSEKGKNLYKPPADILDGYKAGKHKKGPAFDQEFCWHLIDCFKDMLGEHPDWKNFNFSFSATNEYNDMSDFYKEVEEQGYMLKFHPIPVRQVEDWVNQGKLYLFQIYNKDFSVGSTGTPNLHTMYWKALFSEHNLQDVVFKLNGEAELFYRKAVITNQVTHRKGEKMINRRDKNQKPIPEYIHHELFMYANNRLEGELSTESRAYLDKIVIKEVSHDIIKDRRYTQPKFLFHVPITINFKATNKKLRFNAMVREFLRENPEINIIGIDRGERNLIYISLINQQGEILLQKSYNVIGNTDYREKLDQREKERDRARKNWDSIGKIKDLKEGYLSQVVHEIAQSMIKNNAIVVLEDLNLGFKRGRFKVEKQVYQKFEKMLIDKLNYLVFKNRGETQAGGVLKGYQLTDKFKSFQSMGKQSGFIFYVPAAYTSKIDPATGFVNIFDTANLTNVEKKRDFFARFQSIYYDPSEGAFAFAFDFKDFKLLPGITVPGPKEWVLYSKGKRIVYQASTSSAIEVEPTASLKGLFDHWGIRYEHGQDIKTDILSVQAIKENAGFYDFLYRSFAQILQMRNSNTATGEDFIISPVKSEIGESFFDTRKAPLTMPQDADANGAYHIALKGLYVLRKLQEPDNIGQWTIDRNEWLKFAQDKPYRGC